MVNAGAKLCREENVDVILTVGGGSVIDCGKAITVAAYYEGDFWDIIEKRQKYKKHSRIWKSSTVFRNFIGVRHSTILSSSLCK